MFEQADVLIFTLGLTEGWVSQETAPCFRSPPGLQATQLDPT